MLLLIVLLLWELLKDQVRILGIDMDYAIGMANFMAGWIGDGSFQCARNLSLYGCWAVGMYLVYGRVMVFLVCCTSLSTRPAGNMVWAAWGMLMALKRAVQCAKARPAMVLGWFGNLILCNNIDAKKIKEWIISTGKKWTSELSCLDECMGPNLSRYYPDLSSPSSKNLGSRLYCQGRWHGVNNKVNIWLVV
ncbi:hypothetical protein E3N88_39085 [Mikania micrantha]|uniref:Uncharacterized protein n=1 Tax=Mikania micrantha TaxID=192012 RepID=A0A5N6LVT7_9ASTR|nr:hypothetical protein E3N88_39085 [Mikania micrantha]